MNNCLKCQWTECTNQKTKSGSLDLKKKKSLLYVAYRRLTLGQQDSYKLKMKGWKKIFHVNGKDRKGVVAILILDKRDFKAKAIKI